MSTWVKKRVKNIAKPVGAYRVLMEPRVTVAGARRRRSPCGVITLCSSVRLSCLLPSWEWGSWNFYLRAPKVRSQPPKKKNGLSSAGQTLYRSASLCEHEWRSFQRTSWQTGSQKKSSTALRPNAPGLRDRPEFGIHVQGQTGKVQQVSEEMGVRYVLEGRCSVVGRSGPGHGPVD